jgi:mannose-1-phosphate guanylyltransferase/mannose-6-phosphate isomerase
MEKSKMKTKAANYVPVILAGGSGTRLWPLSRTEYPKQFLALAGEQSLLQATVTRFTDHSTSSPVVVCSEQHRFLTAEQLLSIGVSDASILLEPVARNTAPAIGLAAWQVHNSDPDGVMVVLPADHVIDDIEQLQNSVSHAVELAEAGYMVTLGIKPTSPATGYGYISAASPLPGFDSGAMAVSQFIEKPNEAKAAELIATNQCFWNAGIFIFKASVFLKALETHQNSIYNFTKAAVQDAVADLDFLRVDSKAFSQCDNISIDVGVMEKSDNVVVLPYNSGWSDIGSWDAVHAIQDQDVDGNSGVGDVLHHHTQNTYLHSSSRLVVALGTKNISVIETSDAVLVIDHSSAQSIKDAISYLSADNRQELTSHTTCYRPWGHYESLKLHPRFQVKRISVKPGAKLSLQKHFHRSEHWVVVKGTAIVTNGEQEILLTENESTYIPLGTMHRLYNPGTIPLELIEVQSGSYLGEDDIVRVGDNYGRA